MVPGGALILMITILLMLAIHSRSGAGVQLFSGRAGAQGWVEQSAFLCVYKSSRIYIYIYLYALGHPSISVVFCCHVFVHTSSLRYLML